MKQTLRIAERFEIDTRSIEGGHCTPGFDGDISEFLENTAFLMRRGAENQLQLRCWLEGCMMTQNSLYSTATYLHGISLKLPRIEQKHFGHCYPSMDGGA